MHTIEIIDDLMCVTDEDGNGCDWFCRFRRRRSVGLSWAWRSHPQLISSQCVPSNPCCASFFLAQRLATPLNVYPVRVYVKMLRVRELSGLFGFCRSIYGSRNTS